MRNNRTPEQNIMLFNKLNVTVNRYIRNESLFCGGCCYAASVLARCLDNAGIDYKVEVYLDGAFRCRSLKSVCKREACAHVAILMNVNGKDMRIGDVSGVVAGLDMFAFEWKTKEYKAGWREIESAYYNNDWNTRYDIRNNGRFFGDIQKIFAEM